MDGSKKSPKDRKVVRARTGGRVESDESADEEAGEYESSDDEATDAQVQDGMRTTLKFYHPLLLEDEKLSTDAHSPGEFLREVVFNLQNKNVFVARNFENMHIQKGGKFLDENNHDEGKISMREKSR